jgi:hypothetical protein
VSATVGGARCGVVLLCGHRRRAFFKFVLTEGIAPWQIATGIAVLEGEHQPGWVKIYLDLYLLVWTVSASASLTDASGLGLSNSAGGAVPESRGP